MPETNPILQSLYARKSVRVFEEKAIPAGMKQAILEAAAQAPSAGCQQLYTILDITSTPPAKTMSASSASISVIFPFPSSPQLIPTIAQFDMSLSPHLYHNRILGGFPPPTAPYYTEKRVRSK